jgi:hypothetical protein
MILSSSTFVSSDFNRVLGWTKMLAEQAEQKAEKERSKLHRTIKLSRTPLIDDEVEL